MTKEKYQVTYRRSSSSTPFIYTQEELTTLNDKVHSLETKLKYAKILIKSLLITTSLFFYNFVLLGSRLSYDVIYAITDSQVKSFGEYFLYTISFNVIFFFIIYFALFLINKGKDLLLTTKTN